MNSEHALTQDSNPYKVSCLRLSSDLMKCSVEHESLSFFNQLVLCKRKCTWNKITFHVVFWYHLSDKNVVVHI